MNKQTIRDVNLKGTRVLVRVDFNVPIENGKITDDTRITAALPTINAILEETPRSVVLMSHLGRPKDKPEAEFSLKPVAAALSKLLGKPVELADDPTSDAAVQQANNLPDGGLLLLENTRFFPGETKNDPELAKKFARFGDIFVNDAFGSAPPPHSSTQTVAPPIPPPPRFPLEKQLDYLATALEQPKR